MKRYLIFLMCLLFAANISAQSLQGEGTAESPYLVKTADDLNDLRNYLGDAYRGTHFRMTNNIDLENWIATNADEEVKTNGWKPIGSNAASEQFYGHFHGGGYAVSGIWMNRTASYSGLFGYVNGGIIDSLGIKVALLKEIKSSTTYTGGIAGYQYNGHLSNCYFSGDITGGGSYTGALVGYGYSDTISNCYSEGVVTGTMYTGGIAGWISGAAGDKAIVTNSLSSATITASTMYTGGIVGYAQLNSEVYNNVAVNTSITGASRIGGKTGTAVFANNHALATMLINGAIRTSDNAAGTDGEDQTLATLQTGSFYAGLGWTFGSLWAIKEGQSVPYISTICPAPALTVSRITTATTEVTGTFVPETGIKVWVKVGSAEAQEATLNAGAGTWSIAISGQKALDMVSAWTAAEGKLVSLPVGMMVEFPNEGTEEDPFEVYSASDLQTMGTFRDKAYKLMVDIDLTEWINENDLEKGWTPICINSAYQGTFDGNGKTISGLWINRGTNWDGNNSALFGMTSNATIKNLTVRVADGKKIAGNSYLGILVGQATTTTITHCAVFGEVSGSSSYQGGIAGSFSGVMENCYAFVDINTTQNYIGGLVGNLSGWSTEYIIKNSYAQGVISGNQYVGGIAGYNSGTVTECAVLPGTSIINGGRIAGNSGSSLSNNIACEDIPVNRATVDPGDSEVGGDKQHGASASVADLKKQTTYATIDWTFNADNWAIWEENSYPFFAGQASPPLFSAIPIAGATVISGTYEAGKADKVYVQMDANSAQEAELSGGSWTYATDALAVGTKVTIWATAAEKNQSYNSGCYVAFAEGSGTAADPYIIRTGDELYAIRYNLSAHYRLADDIDLVAWASAHSSEDISRNGWLPIIDGAVGFSGELDGQNHTVNMAINRPSTSGLGLFGNITGGTVKDLNMDVDITGSSNLGGIAVSLTSAVIENCHVTGSIETAAEYGSTLGGIAGSMTRSSTIHASSFSGIIEKAYGTMGGIAGYAEENSVISFSYSTANVTGKAGSSSIGGIAGSARMAEINNCSSSGHIQGGASVGGIVGNDSYATKISNCIASGPISGTSNVAGIAGNTVATTTIENCVASMIEISGSSNVSRIANGSSVKSNNLASETMLVQRQMRTNPDDTSPDGKDAAIVELYAQSTYTPADNWTFDTDNWAIWEGGSTPYFYAQAAPATVVTPVYVSAVSIGGTLNPAEAEEVWVQVDNNEAEKATVTGNTWSLEVTGFYPDSKIGVWTTKPDKKRSNSVWASANTEALEGSGTETDPYLIKDGGSLYAIRNVAAGAYYKVINDIELGEFLSKSTSGWLPIGESSAPFEGTIYGGGHVISGFWSDYAQAAMGLFAYIRNSTIDSLTINVGKWEMSPVNYVTDMGILAGVVTSSYFSNCHVSGHISMPAVSNASGGLFGTYSGGTVTNCSFRGAIFSGAFFSGGIAGNPNTTISNCYVVGDTLSGRGYTGGIAGFMGGYNAFITDCYTNITITASMYDAGGIAGYVMKSGSGTESKISNCYSAGNIFGANTAGGIVSTNHSIVTDNVAAGEIISATNSAGRIVGNNTNGGSVTNNYASAGMHIPEDKMVSDDALNGTARNRTELLTETPYMELGWDFTDTWAICDAGVGFPYLQWQSALCIPNDTMKLTYGGSSQTVVPTIINLSEGETPVVTYKIISSGKYASVSDDGTISPLAAGIDTLKVTLINSGYSVKCIIDVSAKSLTVTADNFTKMYGEPDPVLTWQITESSLEAGDALEGELTRSDGSPVIPENAGTHDILRGTLDNPNYDITYKKGTMTITPRPITITADDMSKVYGDPDPVFTYQKTDGSFGFEDTLEDIAYGNLSREEGENGGTYLIGQGALSIIVNYDMTFVDGTFTINRADQTVTLDAIERKCADTDDAIILKAASSSGLPLRFESSNPYVAIVTADDGRVHINGAGTTEFTAYQDGNENYNPAVSFERTFIVDLASSVIKSKWNNEVLLVDNKDGNFAAYQWYRDGQMIDGASEQAYSIYGFVADYTVVIITTDGETLKTCPYTPTLTVLKSAEAKAYPNPVRTSQQLTVELPLADEEANGATVQIFDSNGRQVSTFKATQSQLLMNSPSKSGLYHIRVVTAKGKTVNTKIVVE